MIRICQKPVFAVGLLLALLLSSCSDPVPDIQNQYTAWWSSLSDVEQEFFLRQQAVGRGRIELNDWEAQSTRLVDFADWFNRLEPSQVEAFERWLIVQKAARSDDEVQRQIATEVMMSSTIRPIHTWRRDRSGNPPLPPGIEPEESSNAER